MSVKILIFIKAMTFTYKNHSFNFTRYPESDNATLQPWNAADEHLLQTLEKFNITPKTTLIYNDRFGFLTSFLTPFMVSVVSYCSLLYVAEITLDGFCVSVAFDVFAAQKPVSLHF